MSAASGNYLPVREEWLAQDIEPVLEPALPIVDAHHHFYDRPGWTYLAEDFRADAASGHRIEASVHMQAQTRYRTGPDAALHPVGETEYVAAVAEAFAGSDCEIAAGIVGHCDLRLGAAAEPVLQAHLAAGRGRFRGVRHLSAWDADRSLVNPLSAAPRGLLDDPAYRAGVARLAPLGLSYDAWLFFTQLSELERLARAFPDTRIVVNHCGGVLRIGDYAARRDEAFARWSASMRSLAALPNVFVKLGGLGMRINGFGFDAQPAPPTSVRLAEAWRPWIETCIEAFGADRCMFESNFPVDKGSYRYATAWNAFKRLTASAGPDDRARLFSGTARHVYRL
jgi:predicted TIM-barrel fold metal-dependent hydrolase